MTKKALIIDDEKPLLEIISEVLLLLNIESVQSRSGKDAVALAKVHEAFDVILVDMNMPEMNGKEAYLQLQKTNPKSPVVFMSGSDISARINDMDLSIPNIFLKKPFSIAQLSAVVKKLVKT